MTTSDARKRLAGIHGGRAYITLPPTEPRDQEPPMSDHPEFDHYTEAKSWFWSKYDDATAIEVGRAEKVIVNALLAIHDLLDERLPRLEDVAAEFGVDLDAPDVDPDEALAMDLYHASLLIPPVKEIGPTAWLSERDHEMWLGVAREHIEGEQGNPDTWDQIIDHANRRAEKAEADVERLTRERDDLRDRVDDLIRERGQAMDRTEALRQDAVGEHLHARDGSKAEASLAYVLDRDDERAK